MAHRKPLGSTFTSTFDWQGARPRLLDFLRSEAGTWYRVIGVHETANPEKVRLTEERIASPTGVEGRTPFPRTIRDRDGAHTVHDFHWYPRDRTRAAA